MSALIYHGRGTCDRCEVGNDVPLVEIEDATTSVRFVCRPCVRSMGLAWPVPREIATEDTKPEGKP